MAKIDLRATYKHLCSPTAGRVSVVDVPELSFTTIDGSVVWGVSPGESEEFQQAVQAMYGVAYTVKFMSKMRSPDPVDFSVMALEGLWPADPSPGHTVAYTLLMLQPDHITDDMVRAAAEKANTKRPNPLLAGVRLVRWREGRCIQTMHVGPYSEEAATIERLAGYIAEHGYRARGRHHEIYLGDPRRSKPERLRTVLRQPIEA